MNCQSFTLACTQLLLILKKDNDYIIYAAHTIPTHSRQNKLLNRNWKAVSQTSEILSKPLINFIRWFLRLDFSSLFPKLCIHNVAVSSCQQAVITSVHKLCKLINIVFCVSAYVFNMDCIKFPKDKASCYKSAGSGKPT